MLSFCLNCKTKYIFNPRVLKTNNSKTMLLSSVLSVVLPKSRFIKEQDVSELLSSLDIKTTFSNIPLLGNTLF